jgi:hypothetical protein
MVQIFVAGAWSFAFFFPVLQAFAEPIHVANNSAQLFIDDFLMESSSNLVRTLHQPRKDNQGLTPIIKAKPGTTLLAYGTIVYDPGLKSYVMFVQEFPSRQMYRLVSVDGLTWVSEAEDGFETVIFDRNLELGVGAVGTPGIDVFSCYYDRADHEYPYKGWLYFANCGHDCEGIYFVRSREGKKWERGRQVVNAWAGRGDNSSRKIHQDGKVVYGPGDVTLFSYDPVGNRFLCIFKFFTSDSVGPKNNLRSRAYAFLESLDKPFDVNSIHRISLLPSAAYRNGDTPFDEYYASTGWRYESLWLGGLKIWHGGGDYPHSSAGCAFFKLVVSRDGLDWKKVPYLNDSGIPEVFIANGREGGNNGSNDGGYMSEFSQGPIRVGDELIYYYSASSYGKNRSRDKRLRGGGIFRARLRIDGFVSVDRGTLTTRPLSFTGKDLSVNGIGPITVEVVSDKDEPLAQHRISGDSLKHCITFDGKSLRDLVPGSVVRFKFNVGEGGQLFSFTIR